MYQYFDRGLWFSLIPSFRDWCRAHRIDVRETPATVTAVCNPEAVG